MKDPLEYNRISAKYKFKIVKDKAGCTFIIEHQGSARVIINRCVGIVSWASDWTISDGCFNFRFHIREYPDKYYWFFVLESEINHAVKLMIKILRELRLCTISRAINGITHFNFILKQYVRMHQDNS